VISIVHTEIANQLKIDSRRNAKAFRQKKNKSSFGIKTDLAG
jgi:hypothetical protein